LSVNDSFLVVYDSKNKAIRPRHYSYYQHQAPESPEQSINSNVQMIKGKFLSMPPQNFKIIKMPSQN
jgi:hypothetical protein